MKKLQAISLSLLFVLCFLAAGCGNGDPVGSAAAGPSAAQPVSDVSYSGAKVSFLGPEGTYTQEACEVFFDKQGTLVPYKTSDDAVQALVSGKSDYAVIPQENTIGGAVADYLDIVISNPDVSVVGEVELTINQNLLVLPGTGLKDIHTVYSHKQGIAQGKAWLEKNLPDAEVTEVSSTAEGAKMVSEGRDKSCAAIASAGCADVYGLEILAENIQNNDKNKTRFYVLTTEDAVSAPSDRLAFIASGAAKDLPGLMAGMEEQGMSLIAIHDRPRKTVLGEYYYVIECAECSYESFRKLTEKSPFECRFLGCFDVSQ